MATVGFPTKRVLHFENDGLLWGTKTHKANFSPRCLAATAHACFPCPETRHEFQRIQSARDDVVIIGRWPLADQTDEKVAQDCGGDNCGVTLAATKEPQQFTNTCPPMKPALRSFGD